MQFGVHTFLWTKTFNESNLSLLPTLREYGFDSIEIARYHFDDFPAAKIGAEIQQNGLSCTLCCGLTAGLSLISEERTVRQQALDFLQHAIDMAAELGSQLLVGPLVAPIGYLSGRRRTAAEWNYAIDGLQSLGETLMDYGITLAIEPMNRYQSYFLNTTADGVALCQAVNHPQIGLLVDVFHANIEEKNIPDAIKLAGRHLKHLHLCENDRGIPGTGHLDWPGIFSALQVIQYDQWVVIESFNFQDLELAAGACVWRDLAPTPASIASEGLAFLKTQHNQRHASIDAERSNPLSLGS
jgi:D-psicose/D-tagatose/L-ribulose 3-epimerase